MHKNLLLSSERTPPSLFIYNMRLNQGTHVYKTTLYELMYFLMMNVRGELQHVLEKNYTANNGMLDKLKKAVVAMQYDGNDDLGMEEFITYEFLCSRWQSQFSYRSLLGEKVLSIGYHTAQQRAVLLDFVVHVLDSVDDINALKHYPVSWIEQWDTICEEWAASFSLGTLVNIPDLLRCDLYNKKRTTEYEAPLMV